VADWVSIKSEYVTSDISYRKLAKKHAVSFNTLKDKAIRERWKELRDTTRNNIATAIQQKAVDTISTDAASYAATISRLSVRAAGLVEKSMENQEGKADPYKVKALVSAVRELAEMADKMLGGKASDVEDLQPLADKLGEPNE